MRKEFSINQKNTLAKNSVLRKAARFLEYGGHGSIYTMKITVTGASGLLGRSLMRLLASTKDYRVHGLAFSRAKPPLERLDLTDEHAVDFYFKHEQHEVVVHLAAERRPDIVDKELARAKKINVEATRILARQCAEHRAFFVLISTDYVFDGKSPPYFADSLVNPLNAYGRLKLEAEYVAESELREAPPKDSMMSADARSAGAVLRIPMLYGPVESLEESSVTEIARVLKSKEPRLMDHWAHRYPMHVDDVSAAILKILEKYAGNDGALAQFGVFPRFLLSGFPSYTKYEMAMIMADSLGIDARHVRPDSNPPRGAPRPRDCRMDTSRLESLGWRQQKQFISEIGDIIKPYF